MKQEPQKGTSRLDDLVDGWRRELRDDQRLSPGTRAGILAAVRDERLAQRRPNSLFLPFRRLAIAAVAPALLLTLALGYLLLPRGAGDPGPVGLELRVTKQGEEVVFFIANGGQTHQIYKTSELRDPQWEPYTKTEGTFRDRLETEADLVFYRID